MAEVYVFSTLAADMDYHVHEPARDGVPPARKHTVHIAGGAGIANKNLITPNGVMTTITTEELSLLEQVPLFKMHKDNGYIKVEMRRADAEKVATDMATDDPSKPLTPADYADGDGQEKTKAVSNSSRKSKKN